MNTLITFIIPVRHQANSKNWALLKANLTQTIASISAQTNPNWRAVIVANEGADLPDLPHGFEVVYVDFSPNTMHEQQGNDKEVFYDFLRMDKGSRVLKGMLHIQETAFYMIVDDDDFVSNHIVSYVSENATANGWKINDGYIWGDGGKLLLTYNDFSNFCGTSLIIRSDLYQLPNNFESATQEYIKTMLGSHVKISKILENKGSPLLNLPFRGAVYRIGHPGSHSKSPGILKKFIFNKSVICKPRTFLQHLFKLRLIDEKFKQEFFGEALVIK